MKVEKRWEQLGELLVVRSAGVKPKDRVMIAMTEIETSTSQRSLHCVHPGRRLSTGSDAFRRIQPHVAEIWRNRSDRMGA